MVHNKSCFQVISELWLSKWDFDQLFPKISDFSETSKFPIFQRFLQFEKIPNKILNQKTASRTKTTNHAKNINKSGRTSTISPGGRRQCAKQKSNRKKPKNKPRKTKNTPRKHTKRQNKNQQRGSLYWTWVGKSGSIVFVYVWFLVLFFFLFGFLRAYCRPSTPLGDTVDVRHPYREAYLAAMRKSLKPQGFCSAPIYVYTI